jgi:uncharacterized membrane protein (DUF485 family)
MSKRGASVRDEDFLDRKMTDLAPALQDAISDKRTLYALQARDKIASLVVTVFLLLVTGCIGLLGYMIYQSSQFSEARIQAGASAFGGVVGVLVGVVGVVMGYYLGASGGRRR